MGWHVNSGRDFHTVRCPACRHGFEIRVELSSEEVYRADLQEKHPDLKRVSADPDPETFSPLIETEMVFPDAQPATKRDKKALVEYTKNGIRRV
jgi:hypothetical protein